MKKNSLIISVFTLILTICVVTLNSCRSHENRHVQFYKGTPAFKLAKAVYSDDFERVEEIIRKDSSLLEFSNPISGSTVLVLSMYLEKIDIFKRLLDFGADPNFINPLDSQSILMKSIGFYGSQFEWRVENSYTELLLEYGADPRYYIGNSFVNKNGITHSSGSPIHNAASLDVSTLKLLISYGADPFLELEEYSNSPFTEALKRGGDLDLINYFIDTLNVDVHQPLMIGPRYTLYIQDYLKSPYCIAKFANDIKKMDELQTRFPNIEKNSAGKCALIEKLKLKGVDFENYDYKRN